MWRHSLCFTSFENIKLIADCHGEFAHPFLLLGCNCCRVSALLPLVSDSGEAACQRCSILEKKAHSIWSTFRLHGSEVVEKLQRNQYNQYKYQHNTMFFQMLIKLIHWEIWPPPIWACMGICDEKWIESQSSCTTPGCGRSSQQNPSGRVCVKSVRNMHSWFPPDVS